MSLHPPTDQVSGHPGTAHSVPADAPSGAVADSVPRPPAAVVARILESSDPHRSALAQAVDSATESESVRTPGELFADAAQLATAGRTAKWLDELVHDGRLTTDQRVALAIEDGAASLNNLLRRAELAGHDPRQVLIDAIDQRPLDDARQITNVLQSRIDDRVDLEPAGNTFAEWTPRVDDPDWVEYLTSLARAADDRRNELGPALASDPPRWATEWLGDPPESDRLTERAGWEERAAAVATYRELVGHTDVAEPIGPAPKAGQVEHYSAWQSAWRALGRPEADRAEAEMSTGQLRVRVRAYEREKAWAPDYVADQLVDTRLAANKHRTDAAIWEPRASADVDKLGSSRLRADAAEASALATTLDERARQLTEADEARGAWYAHTAETRAAAERAAAELAARRQDGAIETDPTTAAQWLAAHEAEARAEDPHRLVSHEDELADVANQRARDQRQAGQAEPAPEGAGSTQPDIRQEADKDTTTDSAGARHSGSEATRIPSADETAESVRRAQRVLQELRERQAVEARRAHEDALTTASRRDPVSDQNLSDEDLMIVSSTR